MTTKVVDFLNESGGSNFTENAPRPPTYGEENELQSNGGNSTKSSSSHKSHVSNKSHTSSKSGTSTKGDHSHSPATTPRKSNLEGFKTTDNMTHTSLCECEDSEMAAPLGFEPEGSAANSPPYSENGTPPHLKWAENLSYLLEDSEGVDLFQKFMDNELEGGSEVLQFWFACQGLKRKIGLNEADKIIIDLQKVIYKRYVRGDKVRCISKEVKKEIAENVSTSSTLDKSIFDSAQEEVENYMRNVTYPAFLRSDSYVQYVQNYVESPKSSHSSGSNSARPVSQSGLLPVVHEDKELESKDFLSLSLPVMKAPLAIKRPETFDPPVRRMETMTGSQLYNQRIPYPVHVSYAPVSAQDSELQSLSSDALTDDTISVTDSSVDGYHHPLRKKHRKAVMKNLAQQNRELRTGLHSQIIPRTEHAPKDRNIAEAEPKRFAELLIEKLNKVLEERETTAKMEEKLKSINSVEVEKGEVFSDHVVLNKGNTSSSFMPLIRPVAMEEETAESILDQHCSRIWASSSHHTPSYSPPGHQSPPHNKSPDRHKDARKKSMNVPSIAQNPYLNRSYHKKRDFASVSHDSGIENCNLILCGTETHRHIHHHHHHHHTSRDSSSKKTFAEVEAQACGLGSWRTENPAGISIDYNQDIAGRGRSNLRKSAGGVVRKNSDTSSNIDSGISVMDSVKIPPAWNNPTNEKVMKWMMDSDSVHPDVTLVPDVDKSSSSHRRAQKLNQSAVPAQQSRPSTKSKAFPRSTSVDRADRGAWNGPSAIMPSQPFAQDSSMPLLTPPNPTTQLEEAKRRLETQSRATITSASPAKCKSFTGMRPPPCGTPLPAGANMRSVQPVRNVTTQLDNSSASQSLDYRLGQPANETIIGIYMGTEPIPYRHQLPGRAITLAQIKTLITKRGVFKYYFKRQSDEFADGAGAVFEEISDDNTIVPMWQGKIVVKVDRQEL
ncbi:axin-1 [Biomphalaria pfeifferi]|uniref:Axin-1 n=1 Tax=Biomphalaria pfeifferi TaxID=112525 RepID=A0AAD8B6Z6_BIOPF|nr:axin-1 [Biomphalaria pfeifferi]